MPARTRKLDPSALPDGFVYEPEFISVEEEAELLRTMDYLHFRAFEFGPYTAQRRVVEYGWAYDFGSRRASETQDIPEFLKPLRERAAAFASVPAADLVEAIITQYPPGAPIGWHRDVQQFEVVVGISLASAARMRFKPYKKAGKVVSVMLEPRSAYVIRGAARWQHQHSIPAVEALRYSITFRTLRRKAEPLPKRPASDEDARIA